ncbi:hypothetical protein [Methylobacterium dankookense]|uniref:Uncharacterized protein n=1 Tax=Methylobacterium dankookense TaxID=560405 RepID=A0A564G551_9HYPH|nr:hypothetical protein [Methylobacterium dankookense]GJD59634.1 hypothetical protein IFDJLNFL_5563 [Methylobacterium dankookense]VUF15126.1 hypothetical protein MTDSW087_04859 [Methylobacterium dankookense]
MNLVLHFSGGFEINGRNSYVRLHRGDCEVCLRGWTATALWGPHHLLRGFFLEGHGTDRDWLWSEVRDALVKRMAFWRRSRPAND